MKKISIMLIKWDCKIRNGGAEENNKYPLSLIILFSNLIQKSKLKKVKQINNS